MVSRIEAVDEGVVAAAATADEGVGGVDAVDEGVGAGERAAFGGGTEAEWGRAWVQIHCRLEVSSGVLGRCWRAAFRHIPSLADERNVGLGASELVGRRQPRVLICLLVQRADGSIVVDSAFAR